MNDASPPGGGLKRVMRVRDGLAVTVGIVIGAGILATPGLIAGYMGDPWTILGIWVLGGVVAGLSTLVLAEMAAALPNAGGKYVYAKAAFGPVAGFVAGWSEIFVTRAFSGAAKAVLIAGYVISLTGRGSVPILAGVVCIGFGMVHMGGLKTGTAFQNVTTIVKVLILGAIAAAGLMAGQGRGFAPDAAFSPETSGFLGFALAYQAVAFAYYGWEDAAKLSEETKDPGRSMPRILIGGAIAVAVLYLLINVAFLNALTPAEMAGSDLVAQDAIQSVLGGRTGTLVVLASLLILISSANVNFMGLPRVVFGLARDGLAPKAFTRLDDNGTPKLALGFITAIILGLALTGTFEFLIRFMMLVAISVDSMVLLAFFPLRYRRDDLERPFQVPGGPWLPALAVLLNVSVLVIIVATQPALAVGGGAMLGMLIIGGLTFAPRNPDGENAP